MKRSLRMIIAALLTGVLMITATACGGGSSAQMAKVNDTVISEDQLDKFSTLVYYIWGYDPTEMSVEEKQYFLDVMVECEVLRQYFEDKGENIYDDEYDSGKETFVSTAQSSEADFLKENNITEDDLIYYYRTAYISQKYYNELRTNNEEKLEKDAKDTYEESRASYETEDEKRISVIFVETKEEAETLKKKAESGEDFATLAKENSADTSSAENGGDMGFVTKDTMDASYGEGLFELKVGDVSEPTQVDGGYLVVKITDENTSGYKNFEEVKDSIIDQLLNDIYTEEIKKIKADMTIEEAEIKE